MIAEEAGLTIDFAEFFPQLQAHVSEWVAHSAQAKLLGPSC